MLRRAVAFISFLIVAIFTLTEVAAAAPVKMAIFNFQTVNMEASGQGTAVTNMLLTSLMAERSLNVLDRKDLEAFLTLNDFQQNDKMDNVITIGTRLGLNMIVVGSVEKKGSILLINCRVIGIEQKKVIYSKQIRSLGDAGLASEINDLGKAIVATVTNAFSRDDGQSTFPAPVNIKVRPGNKQIQISWEVPANAIAVAYEVFRATNQSGPYAKVSQVTIPEYADQNLEKNVLYYYKVRAYNERGARSEFSEIFFAETVLTPNPPVILKADSHIRSIQITWTPNPMSSGDPLRLRGYKIYRSKAEPGPYKEVANLLGKDLGIGIDTATTLDKIFKVSFTDKGLTDGETVYYKVTAFNEKNLESEYSSPIRGLAVSPVTNIYAQGDLVREVRLSWAALEGSEVKGYNLYRSTMENDGFKKIAVIDQPANSGEKKLQYKDSEGLADSVRYYYRISAFETPEAETSPKVTVSAITKGKPSAPQDVRAVSGLVKKIEISCAPSNDAEVEGYKLYAARQSDGQFFLIKKLEGRNNSKFVDEDRARLDDSTKYYYRLTCYNKVDVESSSVEVSATTKPRPSRPHGLKGESLKLKEVPLAWEANPENDISTYRLWRLSSEGGEFKEIAKIAARTDYLDKELQDGVSYSYKLQTEDRDGLVSEFSESTNVRTKPRPQSPTGLSSDLRSGRVNLKWDRGREPDIAYYRVYEKKFFGNEKIADEKTNAFNETAPPKGKTKTYLVTTVDADGLESNSSREIIVTGR
jgi:fibronectin type 3 domain-containing protein/TolB-like protein